MPALFRATPFSSRAVHAARGSASLRVTIPQVVAATLGVHAGDELLWFVDPSSGQVVVEARPKAMDSVAAEATEPHATGPG